MPPVAPSGWEFHSSERVARFLTELTVRDEARLLRIFLIGWRGIRSCSLTISRGMMRKGGRRGCDSRTASRFFLIDHTQKEARAIDVGFE
jgi:hypothetical protein